MKSEERHQALMLHITFDDISGFVEIQFDLNLTWNIFIYAHDFVMRTSDAPGLSNN